MRHGSDIWDAASSAVRRRRFPAPSRVLLTTPASGHCSWFRGTLRLLPLGSLSGPFSTSGPGSPSSTSQSSSPPSHSRLAQPPSRNSAIPALEQRRYWIQGNCKYSGCCGADQRRDPPLTYTMYPPSSFPLSSTTTSCVSESRHSRLRRRTLSARSANSSASTSGPPSSASMRAIGEQALQVAALLEAEDRRAGDGDGGEKLRAGFVDWHRVRLRPERSRRQDRVWQACRWLASVRSSPPSSPERTGRIRKEFRTPKAYESLRRTNPRAGSGLYGEHSKSWLSRAVRSAAGAPALRPERGGLARAGPPAGGGSCCAAAMTGGRNRDKLVRLYGTGT